jgi:hypothetical protein
LSSARKSDIGAARAAIEAEILQLRTSGNLKPDCEGKEGAELANCKLGLLEMTFAGGRETTRPYMAFSWWLWPNEVARRPGATLMTISQAFPLGYGYALYLQGDASPEGGDPALAKDGTRRASEEKIKAVKKLLSSK